MLSEVLDSCREQTSQKPPESGAEAVFAIEKFVQHAIRSLDKDGARKAFEVAYAAMDFLEHYKRLPEQQSP